MILGFALERYFQDFLEVANCDAMTVTEALPDLRVTLVFSVVYYKCVCFPFELLGPVV